MIPLDHRRSWHAPAQPYLTPAAEAARSAYPVKQTQAVRRALSGGGSGAGLAKLARKARREYEQSERRIEEATGEDEQPPAR